MIKRILASITATLAVAILLTPAFVFAATPSAKQSACEGAGGTWSGTTCNPSGATVSNVVATAVQLFSVVIGLVAVVMFLVGGLKYITSQGDPQSVSSAKNTLLYATIGIIVAAMAQALVKFVLNKVK